MFSEISKTISSLIELDKNDIKLLFNPQICSVNFLTFSFIALSDGVELVEVVVVEVVNGFTGVADGVLKLNEDKDEGLSEFDDFIAALARLLKGLIFLLLKTSGDALLKTFPSSSSSTSSL
jgi:hypothetical protein